MTTDEGEEMRVGLMLTSEWGPDEDLTPKLDQLVEQVRVARDSGFASIWIVQHFLSGPNRQFQAMPLLGRIAAETGEMTLGTSILLLPMLSPVLLAEEVAALDWFTGGRFVLGVGMGYRDHEFHAFGTRRSERVARFVEHIEVMRKLWTGEPVHHRGRFVRLEGQQVSLVPRQKGGVPIWIGATAEPAVRRAARIGDGWLTAGAMSFDELGHLSNVFEQERREAGRPLDYVRQFSRECWVGPDDASAWAKVEKPIMSKYERYSSFGFGPGGGGKPLEFREIAEDRFVIGDEGRVRDELQRYRDALRVDEFRFRMQWPGIEQADLLDSIRRMGRVAAKL